MQSTVNRQTTVKPPSRRLPPQRTVRPSPLICKGDGCDGEGGFVVTLEPVKSWHTSPIQRLRIAAKSLLRAHGLRIKNISMQSSQTKQQNKKEK